MTTDTLEATLADDGVRRIGRYEVVRTLGEGGMGVVYEGRDPGNGARVAIKTVRMPEQGLLGSIRREIHALAALRHPGIVRIADEGVLDGLPWYAMELVEGVSMRDRLASAGDVTPTQAIDSSGPTVDLLRAEDAPRAPVAEQAVEGLPLQEALTLVRKLCAPLAYLHGEGLVHRDLKPENVIVRPGDEPVIVDFGLTAAFEGEASRESLQALGLVVGTLAYISPEQARGQIVDARSDLYALGCILFELLAGRPPFLGGSAAELLAMHLHVDPPALSGHAPDVPPELDALVARLLAKEPRERIGHADVVAAQLESLGAPAAADEARHKAYLYRPSLVGRDAALARLQAPIGKLRREGGRLLLLAGESGIGKTRLLVELMSFARQREVAVLPGQCGEPAPGGARSEPLQGLRAPLGQIVDACLEHGPAKTELFLGKRGRILAPYQPGIAALPEVRALPEPPELAPEDARLRLYTALADTLAAFAGNKGALLVLDDLQWADELTLGLVDFLLRSERLPAGRLLVVGAFRSEEATPAIDALAARVTTRVDVGKLEEDALGGMVAEMLGLAERAPALSRYLAARSEGNPLFVAEYLRLAIAEGILARDRLGAWEVRGEGSLAGSAVDFDRLPLPGSVRDLVERRLAGLGDDALRILRAASVIGREMTSPLLDAVAGVPELAYWDGLRELLARQLLEEPARGMLRIGHGRVRDVAHEQMAATERGELHLGAARALDAQAPEQRDAAAARIAEHLELGGRPGEAAPRYLGAARLALRQHAHVESERLFGRFLALASPGRDLPTARLELARDVLGFRGRGEEALAMLSTGREEAAGLREEELAARIEATRVHVLRDLGRLEEAIVAGEGAIAAARFRGDDAGAAAILGELAAVEIDAGRSARAREMSEEALTVHRGRGDVAGEVQALRNLVLVAMGGGELERAEQLCLEALGRVTEAHGAAARGRVLTLAANVAQLRGNAALALERYEQILVLARDSGDLRLEGVAAGNMAIIHDEQGRLERARPLYAEALRRHREVGDRQEEATVLGNMAILEHTSGSLEESARLYARALHLSRAVGNRRLEGVLLGNMASLMRDRGEGEAALVHYETALAIHHEVGERRFAAYVAGEMAELLASKGRDDAARACYAGALAQLEQARDPRLEGMLLVGLGRLERASGELEAAAAHVKRGAALLEESGDRVELALALVEAGQVAVASGGDGRPWLERGRSIAIELAVEPGSRLRLALDELGAVLDRLHPP